MVISKNRFYFLLTIFLFNKPSPVTIFFRCSIPTHKYLIVRTFLEIIRHSKTTNSVENSQRFLLNQESPKLAINMQPGDKLKIFKIINKTNQLISKIKVDGSMNGNCINLDELAEHHSS